MDNSLRLATVQRSEHACLNLEWLWPGSWHHRRQIMRKLENHVRLPTPLFRFPPFEVFQRIYLNRPSEVRIGYIKIGANLATLNHHPPAKTMLRIEPSDSPSIKKVTQWNTNLDAHINRD